MSKNVRIGIEININQKTYSNNYVFSEEADYAKEEIINSILNSIKDKLNKEMKENEDEGF